MTVQEPSPDLLYDVRVILHGDPERVTFEDLGKKLLANASSGLRRRCEGLSVSGLVGSAEVSARVNDWNAAAAAMRLATLIMIRAGDGWDRRRMSVHAEPAVPLSSCCQAVAGSEGEVTLFWRCLGCSQPCGIMPV